MMKIASRRSRIMVALAAALVFAGSAAEARVGGGKSSFGSRGARTYSAPPSTNTAPSAAAPIQRSQTPNQGPSMSQPGMASQATQPRRFGFGTGLMAGLLGAGLFGMLMGHGFFGGLAGIGSFLGLLLQIGLIVLVVSFAMKWFRRRQQGAYAGPGQSYERSMPGAGLSGGLGGLSGGLGGLGGGLGGAQQAPRSGPVDEVGIGERDYAAFEKALIDVQDAYTRGDAGALWALATPEMAGYMQEELHDNAARGVVNKVSDVRLLQGDLAESWREGGAEYATVAMRYSLIDVTMDKATSRVVEGHPSQPVEATELWTFRRDQGGPWKLSAMQQS
ncbi:Tim44 domain-containing protein [Microvirga terricola]|uniref:Tim44 domain-containing protein n=1 Tax=Microvirga terricola TaxID=2719797 RepID=A0ABX0V8V0_9HYPH|nr:Tim44 domain-containing protein [Microvirga terricola]NIX76284.1 Tim44 domain-containing protein [Microvirga terricola]